MQIQIQTGKGDTKRGEQESKRHLLLTSSKQNNLNLSAKKKENVELLGDSLSKSDSIPNSDKLPVIYPISSVYDPEKFIF